MEKGKDEDPLRGGRDSVVLEISIVKNQGIHKREDFKTHGIFKVCREFE